MSVHHCTYVLRNGFTRSGYIRSQINKIKQLLHTFFLSFFSFFKEYSFFPVFPPQAALHFRSVVPGCIPSRHTP